MEQAAGVEKYEGKWPPIVHVQQRFSLLCGNQTEKLVLEKLGSVLGYLQLYLGCLQCAV